MAPTDRRGVRADMRLKIDVALDYRFATPTAALLQIEAAAIPEQRVESQSLDVGDPEWFARVPAQDGVGERIWLRCRDLLNARYSAIVRIDRIVADVATLPAVPLHQLPGETVQYLMDSRYCPAQQFQSFVGATFGDSDGGARVAAIRDWIAERLSYVAGASGSDTTAVDTFVQRRGVCRDYAHLLVTLVRASAIPARFASVYAPDVSPPDFHAVAEVFLAGEWHLVDATGMATESEMAKIGIGRDAADVSFLTTYGEAEFVGQSVAVERID